MAFGIVPRFFVATLLLAGSLAGTAWADGSAPEKTPNKIECIAADTDGQSLRLAGKLLQARKRLAGCAAASCPAIVRDDCVERIADLDVVQPTIVFTATNGDGRPLVAVRLTVDGVVVASRLDGRPVPVDPGDHLFAFDALGRVSAQMRLTLHEGEKRVRHAVVLHTESGDRVAAVPAPEPVAARGDEGASDDSVPPLGTAAPPAASAGAVEEAPPPTDAAPPHGLSEGRIAAIVAGGFGVVGVAVGSVFGLETISAWNAAQRDCGAASPCPANGPKIQQEEGDASKDGAISTFAFVAGGVGLALGAWFWFMVPESTGSRVSVVPIAGPSQGELTVRGRF
jgi:hypothetical protein